MIESLLLAATGTAIILLVFIDIIWSMMGEGAGFLTRRINGLLWGIFKRIYKLGFSDFALLVFGIAVIVLSLLILILLLWAGWFLLFFSNDDSVINTLTKTPANLWDKIYFVGFTLFTLGTGDFVPNGKLWQLLTPISALCGLFIVTFSITYLVPVIQSATFRRSLSVFIFSLGNSPEKIVDNFWNGKDFSGLISELNSISKEIAILEQRHKAYPVLYYLHSIEKKESLSLSLSRLNEALTIILYAFKEQVQGQEKIDSFRRIVDYFLGTLNKAFIKQAADIPPLPSVDKLINKIHFYDQETFEQKVVNESDRRKLLYGYIKAEEREWEQIYQ